MTTHITRYKDATMTEKQDQVSKRSKNWPGQKEGIITRLKQADYVAQKPPKKRRYEQ
jgi:hypothetical protein